MSRIIKPQFYISLDDIKQLNVSNIPVAKETPPPPPPEPVVPAVTREEEEEVRELLAMKEQILRDAEAVAEAELTRAKEESAAIRQEAEAEIEKWWQERRSHDLQAEEEAAQRGFEKGFLQGQEQAEAQVLESYDGLLAEARTVLEQAYDMKRQIIQESEPFLVELSTAIAAKIIQQELSLNPQWIIGMTRSVLARKREKGAITLCVSPKQFAYIRDARDELLLALDSQAELQILPDSTVGDNGCVVRTDFGSVDARVETQLKEIKNALQSLSAQLPEGDEEA